MTSPAGLQASDDIAALGLDLLFLDIKPVLPQDLRRPRTNRALLSRHARYLAQRRHAGNHGLKSGSHVRLILHERS